jgi:hypothetical protein
LKYEAQQRRIIIKSGINEIIEVVLSKLPLDCDSSDGLDPFFCLFILKRASLMENYIIVDPLQIHPMFHKAI